MLPAALGLRGAPLLRGLYAPLLRTRRPFSSGWAPPPPRARLSSRRPEPHAANGHPHASGTAPLPPLAFAAVASTLPGTASTGSVAGALAEAGLTLAPPVAAAAAAAAAAATATTPCDTPPDKKAERKAIRLFKRLWKVVKPHLAGLLVAGALAIASAALGIASPGILGDLFQAMGAKDMAELLLPAAKLAALFVGRFALQWVYSTFLANSTEAVASALRQELVAAVLERDMPFFDAHDSGELVAAVMDDVKDCRDALRAVIGEGLPAVTKAVGGAVSLALISPKLALAMGAALPVMIGIGNAYAGKLRRMARRSQEAQARTAAAVSESVLNVRVVRAFNGEDVEVEKVAARLSEASALSKAVGIEVNRFHGLTSVGLSALAGAIVFYGGVLVSAGELTRGQVSAFLAQSLSLEQALESLSVLFAKLSRAQGSGGRIAGLLDDEAATATPAQASSSVSNHPPLTGDIVFEGVRFAYPSRPDSEVLAGVNLHIPAGKSVALVGHSGAGKTSLVSLLMGLYSPAGLKAGRILIDGMDMRDLDVTWLRSHMAYVPQDTTALFNATIRENIAYGRSARRAATAALQQPASPAEQEDAIIAAAKAAQCWDFVTKLPAGLDTRVGERGSALSGGQRQRVAIARALLRDPRILIMDEYSSALDPASEAAVQAALQSAMKGRTTIIIAHRLSTVAHVDLVYVLGKGGKVLEAGPPSELAAKPDGVYASMLRTQGLLG